MKYDYNSKMEDVKYTFELLPKIISETDFDKQVISYRSSW